MIVVWKNVFLGTIFLIKTGAAKFLDPPEEFRSEEMITFFNILKYVETKYKIIWTLTPIKCNSLIIYIQEPSKIIYRNI